MRLLLTVLVGAVAGAHASIWGMYKDAPHEGFTWVKFVRSVGFGSLVAPLLAGFFSLDPTRAAHIVLLWGAAYVGERGIAELYKTFLRSENQSKYFIPMQFAILGRPVSNRWLRALAGVGYATGIGVILFAVSRISPSAGGFLGLVAIGSIGGWISAFGGAWKDAPFEGFQIFKFFRSPLLSAGFAALLAQITDRPMIILLAATGLTIAATETYKTFFKPNVPRGKFAGKPVLFPDWLAMRRRFTPVFVLIWLMVTTAFAVALVSPGDLAKFVAFVGMTAWCHGPLSPVLPAAYEPVLLAAGQHSPALVLAVVGGFVSTGAEWANYHVYGGLVRSRAGAHLLATGPSVWLRSWFDRRPFLTTWLVIWTPVPDLAARLLAVHAGYSPVRYLSAVFLARVPRFWLIATVGAMVQPSIWLLVGLVVISIGVGVAARVRKGMVARAGLVGGAILAPAQSGPSGGHASAATCH